MPMETRRLELDTRVAHARRDYFFQRSNRSKAENTVKKQVWQKLKTKLTAKQIQRKIAIKMKTRTLLKSKGPKAQKNLLGTDRRIKKKEIGNWYAGGERKNIPNEEDKNKEIELFFTKKFKATINLENISPNEADNIDVDTLGNPKRVLTQKDSDKVSQEITLEELFQNIQQLDSSKAEGEDGVTNSMLKNLPEASEKKLVEIFNNGLMSGCVSEESG